MSQYGVEIDLDIHRELILNFESLAALDERLEARYGLNFSTVITRMSLGSINFNILADIFWYGFRVQDKTLEKPKLVKMLSKAIAEKKYRVAELITFINDAGLKSGVLEETKEAKKEGESLDEPPLD